MAANPQAAASVTCINTGVLAGYRWHYLARIWQTPLELQERGTHAVDADDGQAVIGNMKKSDFERWAVSS